MRVLVGIPTYRRPELLRACIASVQAQSFRDFDILVADNDPVGREGHAVASALGVEAIVVPEPGLSSVRNAILKRAHDYDYIAWLDDDMTASCGWLENLLDVATFVDAVGCPVRYEGMPREMAPAFWTNPAPTGPVPILYGTGGSLVCCRFLWKNNYPRFDPAFNYTGGEDSEWFARLKRRGARFGWSAEAVAFEIVHCERSNMRWFLRRNYRIGGCHMEIARRHGSVAIETGKAMGVLALSPIYAIGLVGRGRFDVLAKWARAVGKLGNLAGHTYSEYALSRKPLSQSPNPLR